ncbi:efflux RND transporter permease subunit, partial [bacterium]
SKLGSEFLPSLDEGSLALQVFRIPSISLTESLKINEKVETITKSFPEVLDVVSKTGRPDVSNDPMGVEISDVIITLKPMNQWQTADNKEELVDKMREELEKIQGVAVSFSQPIALRVDELISGVKSQIAIKIFGEDKDILNQYAAKVQSSISKVKGATDINVEQTTGLSNLEIRANRDAIARYGINVSDVQDIVETAIGGKTVSEVIEGQKRFGLSVRLNPENELKLDNIRNLLIHTPQGQNIPLSNVADIDIKDGPAQSSREDGQNRIVIECNVSGRDIGSFVAEAKSVLDKEVKLPSGYYVIWGGQFENQERAFNRLLIIIPVSLIMIFLEIVALFAVVMFTILIVQGVRKVPVQYAKRIVG